LRHWEGGSGQHYVLDSGDIDQIVSSKYTQKEMDKSVALFVNKLRMNRRTLPSTPTWDMVPSLKPFVVTYPQPQSKRDRSNDADLFYAFHNL
jgi:hypothetical protein